MAKKKETTKQTHGNISGHIEGAGIIHNQLITDTLETNYMPYAMSVIVSRAIPEIDGFKPSHRKILYTMYGMKLLSGARSKSANIVGQVMKLNPHGDQAIYETMVRLSKGNETLLYPFVDSKGNFGKAYSRDMEYAAARYTEARLSPIGAELFKDIDKNTVEFVDNYDNTTTEPTLLPVTFPTLLVNSNIGIAVGMASSICSFNLTEVCNTTIEFIKNPNHRISKTLKAPDFPVGGFVLYDQEEMEKIYDTGRGSVKIRGKYTFDKVNNCIDITEIPPTTTIEVIIDKIIALAKAGRIKGVSDVRDETDLSGLKITIDLKRGTNPDTLMQKLYHMTPMQDNFSCNFNILVRGEPRVMGIPEILGHWVDFRLSCVHNKFRYELRKQEEKRHLLAGLSKVLLDIDKVIKIIRETEEEKEVIPNLIIGLGVDEIQADFIAEIKLRNLNKEYILKRIEEIKALDASIEENQKVIGSEEIQKEIIISELKEIIKKYGTKRRTLLMDAVDVPVLEEEELIPDYPVVLLYTKEGYLKKITPQSLRVSGEQKLKEEDEVVQEVEASNRSELLFFTNQCRVYKKIAGEFEDGKASLMGDYVAAACDMEADEVPIYMVKTDDYSGFLLFFFSGGRVSRVPLSEYQTKTRRKRLLNAYTDKLELVKMAHVRRNREFIMVSSGDRMLLVHSENIEEMKSKSAQGVRVMKIPKKHKLKDAILYRKGMLEDGTRYKAGTSPSSGGKINEEDLGKQLSLFED